MASASSTTTPQTFTLVRGNNGLGFNITGGKDQPHLPNDDGIFVTKIRETAAAGMDGRLKEGDKILEVNGNSLLDLTHKQAVDIFLNAGDKVELQVWHGAERHLINEYTMRLQKKNGGSGLRRLMFLAGIVLLGSISYYYAKKRMA